MGSRILVVEDDHPLRDVILRGLREEDFDPVPAPDGAAAMRVGRVPLVAGGGGGGGRAAPGGGRWAGPGGAGVGA
ncbi:hypothetical protein ACFXB3_04625, partial [Streptomyces sp. NPDC059447]